MAVVHLPSRVLALAQRRLKLGARVGRGARTEAHRALLEGGLGVLQPVVVKLFDTAPSDDSDSFLHALAHAAARAALVQHPNVARVYECGEEHGRAFLVTEDVPGVSLHHLLRALEERESRLGFDVALFISCEIADALAGALAAPGRVFHGDLSPRQVMLAWSGAVKVTDFEIGRVTVAQSGVRSLRAQSSRLENLAPELVRGSPMTPRSDVFALGILLRQLFVGRRFPRGLSHAEVLQMVREGQVDAPSFRARIPRELSELILTATAVSPDERFASAHAVAAELRAIAFKHGVGDARPFLARALQRALPDEAPPEASDEDESLRDDAHAPPFDEGADFDDNDDDDREDGPEDAWHDDDSPTPHDAWPDDGPTPHDDLPAGLALGPSRAANAWRDDDDDEFARASIHRDDDLARTSLRKAERDSGDDGDGDDLARTSLRKAERAFSDDGDSDDDDLARTSLRKAERAFSDDDDDDDLSRTSVLRVEARRPPRAPPKALHDLEGDADFDPEATVNLR